MGNTTFEAEMDEAFKRLLNSVQNRKKLNLLPRTHEDAGICSITDA